MMNREVCSGKNYLLFGKFARMPRKEFKEILKKDDKKY